MKKELKILCISIGMVLIVIIIGLVISLLINKDDSLEITTFEATITDITNQIITVNANDANFIGEYSFEITDDTSIIYLGKEISLTHLTNLISIYNNFEITFSGEIKETSPAQIENVTKVELVVSPSDVNIVAYINNSVDSEEIQVIKEKIEKIENISSVTFKSRDEWQKEMSESNDIFNEVFGYLEENPLSDSFIINLDNLDNIDEIVSQIEGIDGIESVIYW